MEHSLTVLCHTQNIAFEKSRGDFFALVPSGQYPHVVYSVSLTKTGNDRIGLLMQFPPCAVEEIPEVEKLCELLSQNFASGATISYDDTGPNFFVYDVVDKDALNEYLTAFAKDCDVATPLCESVGEFGRWSNLAVLMAFCEPHELYQ